MMNGERGVFSGCVCVWYFLHASTGNLRSILRSRYMIVEQSDVYNSVYYNSGRRPTVSSISFSRECWINFFISSCLRFSTDATHHISLCLRNTIVYLILYQELKFCLPETYWRWPRRSILASSIKPSLRYNLLRDIWNAGVGVIFYFIEIFFSTKIFKV